MQTINCNKCNNTLSIDLEKIKDKVFCPYCGNEIILNSSNKNEDLEIKSTINDVLKNNDPVKIHEELVLLDKNYPNNLDIKKALLLQGNLHLRNKKLADFSIIHSYMLNIYLEPNEIKKDKFNELHNELINGQRLNDCLKVANDKNKFLQQYYVDISENFINLFMKNSSRYIKSIMGIKIIKNEAKALSFYGAKIIKNIFNDSNIEENLKTTIAKSFYIAYGNVLGNEYQFINEYLDNSIYRILISEYPTITFGAINE